MAMSMKVFHFGICWVFAWCVLHDKATTTFAYMQGVNQSSSASSNSSVRGRGTHTGSGSSTGGGSLPLCTDCFGHGVNPSIDPRCRIGCRGGGRPTGSGSSTNLFPTTMNQFAFANPGSNSLPDVPKYLKWKNPNTEAPGERKHDSSQHGKKRKTWMVGGGIFILLLASLAFLAYCKKGLKRRQARVGVAVTVNTQLEKNENV